MAVNDLAVSCILFFWIISCKADRPKSSVLMELVKKPCSISDITATQHLISPLRDKIHACDGDTSTFYHSVYDQGEDASPFFTLQLGCTFLIETITVVNVHTGRHCERSKEDAKDCTERINGANVQVLADDVEIKACGRIIVTNNTLTAEAQTYPIDCVDGAEGNKVRVRLENTDRPLEIAEISVLGYRKISELQDLNSKHVS